MAQWAEAKGGPTLGPGPDRGASVESVVQAAGGRIQLAGVLGDLRRVASPVSQQLTRLAVAFTWDAVDRRDRRWWPQGVTGSWDRTAAPSAAHGDGEVLVTTAYAQPVGGVRHGARVTVHDVSDLDRVRYDHVLLAHASVDDRGRPELRPVIAHAGGAAWVGRHLHVAATARGFHTFDPEDIVAADAVRGLGLPEHGHRFVLPARTTYISHPGAGTEPLRFSFLSVAHEVDATRLLVGEYGRRGATTRLWTYDLDAESGLPLTDAAGLARPSFLRIPGVDQMQGAVLVDGALHVVTSRGRLRRGSIWTEQRGRLVEHEYALPPGPEDVSHRRSSDQLWTLTEYPHSRMVAVVDRGHLG